MKKSIGERIAYHRKMNSMTQGELAVKLNVSTQAVSKWEQNISSPDISLLPEIASVFSVSIDELFGKKIDKEPVFNLVDSVPWDDDRKIRIAVYHGKKLMQQSTHHLQKGTNIINVHFDYGEAYKVCGICKLNI